MSLRVFLLTLVVSCSLAFAANAQTALDFTITDYKGVSHNLQHALDQGFIVVLEFFFADCGPCINAAQELQAIHEDYENKNVLIWAISDIDDDSRLWDYEYELGLSFVMAGIDGGGIEVKNAYTDSFGFEAYPTIAVICPDGSMTWDIFPYSEGAPEWRNSIEACGVEEIIYEYIPFGGLTAVKKAVENTTSIYPNPAHDYLFIENQNKPLTDQHYEIYNSTGSLVRALTVANAQPNSIPIGDLSPGMYFIKTHQEDGSSHTQAFLKAPN